MSTDAEEDSLQGQGQGHGYEIAHEQETEMVRISLLI